MRSSSIIGGASVANIAIGLVRTKLAAMLLGPAGIGLIGLYTNLVSAASTLAGLGFGTVGTRQIAEAAGSGEVQKIAIARRALFWGTMGLALVGALVFWLLRYPVSVHVIGNRMQEGEVGWLALGVALSVAAASQGALLRGLRRIGDVARATVVSSVFSTVLGVGALLLWGRSGLLVYVLAIPLASFLVGHWFVGRLPRIEVDAAGVRDMTAQWSVMARLGFAFMVAGLAGTIGTLVVRSMVQRELGEPALGHFQAAWVISMQYIGFVLGAMGTDFYPRLTAVIGDRSAASTLVNEQTEVALLLSSPVVLAMAALAPWVIDLLYTPDFREAVAVLRWQLIGDVLKIASWPLGFVMLAAGAGRIFVVTQWSAALIFAGSSELLTPHFGLPATGVAFMLMYLTVLLLNFISARRRIGFRWRRSVLLLTILITVSVATVAILSIEWPLLGAGIGVATSCAAGIGAIRRLHAKDALPRRLENILATAGFKKAR